MKYKLRNIVIYKYIQLIKYWHILRQKSQKNGTTALVVRWSGFEEYLGLQKVADKMDMVDGIPSSVERFPDSKIYRGTFTQVGHIGQNNHTT